MFQKIPVDTDLLSDVPGGRELVAWFGKAPGFHDAEVLSLTLDHAGATCSIRVHAFEGTSEVDARGFYRTIKHAVVTFLLGGLTKMQLEDFAAQNVIMKLSLTRSEECGFRLELDASIGLSGVLEGRSLQIAVEPGIPPGSQYLELGERAANPAPTS